MSDPRYEALLLAVLAEPDEDGPRLILADYLDERGDGDRAEFIRVQCELAGPAYGTCSCAILLDDSDLELCMHCALRRREWEFWTGKAQLGTTLPPGWLAGLRDDVHDPVRPDILCVVRRGFVCTARCPLADWLAHGPDVVRRQPVERVETEVRPSRGHFAEAPTVPHEWQGKPFWLLTPPPQSNGWSSDQVPWDVWHLLPPGLNQYHRQYATEEAALAALSDALLLHARRQAFPCGACGSSGRVTPDDGWGARDKCRACGGRGWKVRCET